MMRLSDDVCDQARALIASRLGLDFSERRQGDLERCVIRACGSAAVSTPEAYLAWLATLPDQNPEWRRLAGYLTVGETYFFRDRVLFAALEQQVLPPLITARRSKGIPRLRLWSAGCATGEEPYSLAILLDRLLPDCSDWAVTILATDITPEALEAARRGCYREWSFRETPEWIRERYFHRRGAETSELDPTIRRMVTVAPLNLVEHGYPNVVTNTSAMDLILCRNVLMYFTREAQRAVVARLQRALVTGGWLVVSPAEASAELFRPPLVPVTFPGAILYRNAPGPVAPLLPHWQAETVWLDAPVPRPFVEAPGGLVTAEPPVPSRSPTPCEAPLNTATDLGRARALADQGRLEAAQDLCEAVLTRNRLDPDAHLLLAAIHQERGELGGAIAALRGAIYLAPDSAPAHFLLGSLLFRQGKRRQGQRSLETVVSLLSRIPPDAALPGCDGLTAGRLLDTARVHLELGC
jgi:chemotaxis protein methyltransferase CheR